MTSSVVHSLRDGASGDEILRAALALRGAEQQLLFQLACELRAAHVGDQVEVRSVIEVSNICHQRCNYCGIGSTRDADYTIGDDDLLRIVQHIHHKGRRCLLIQSGEDRSPGYLDSICRCVERAKQRYHDLLVILCLGNLGRARYQQLRQAGADRYILKFETSSPTLYRQVKPNDTLEQRVRCLRQLIEVGFEVGTGNIVGLPGQSVADLVADLRFLSRFELTMVSCSAFIPGPSTPYHDQPAGDLELTLNYMALLRILYPTMLIPTTSSLEKDHPDGQFRGLMAGANTVTIHDGTPAELKEHFPIYSTDRFAPDEQHIMAIVERAGLRI